MLTLQECLNQVFAKVKVKSVDDDNNCIYSGTGCAIGVLIDPKLAAKMDTYSNSAIKHLAKKRDLALPDYVYTNLDFLEQLQDCHDFSDPEDFLPNFHQRLAQLATDFNLVMPCN
jgi:hypothetical protein